MINMFFKAKGKGNPHVFYIKHHTDPPTLWRVEMCKYMQTQGDEHVSFISAEEPDGVE